MKKRQPVSRPQVQKCVYTVLGLVTLGYTIAGSCAGFMGTVDYIGPAPVPDTRYYPMKMGVFVLVTGIPLFLLFLFLERRAAKRETESHDSSPGNPSFQ